MILPCTCPHPFQDQRYGKGQRVHNPTQKGEGKNQSFRCTVCETLRAKSGK